MQIVFNCKPNSSPATGPKQQGSILAQHDFKGILSDEARRLGNFRNEHPGSDQDVYQSVTDSSPLLSKANQSSLEMLAELIDNSILNGMAQQAKSMDFLDEYTKAQEAAQKAKETASEAPVPTSSEAGSDAASPTSGQAASGTPA